MTITNGYVTLNALKTALGISDSGDDADLERAIEAASRLIDGRCERHFYQAPSATARVYRARENTSDVLHVDDISTTTGLIVRTDTAGDGTYATTLAASAYQLEPLNAIAQGWPATRIINLADSFPVSGKRATVQVTARWGWPTVPTDINQACLILALRMWKRKDSPEGVMGFGDFGPMRLGRTDPDVEAILAPYIKHGFG